MVSRWLWNRRGVFSQGYWTSSPSQFIPSIMMPLTRNSNSPPGMSTMPSGTVFDIAWAGDVHHLLRQRFPLVRQALQRHARPALHLRQQLRQRLDDAALIDGEHRAEALALDGEVERGRAASFTAGVSSTPFQTS